MAKYRIADLLVEYEPQFDRVRRNAEPYRVETEQTPDMGLTLPEDFFECAKECYPQLSCADIEYGYVGQWFHCQLLDFGGSMLHASAVMMDGAAYLFTAPCGTGKSTHTTQWVKAFGAERAQILNDDKPAVRKRDGVYYAYGTPFCGKADISVNTCVPLGGICILERGTQNAICRMEPKAAINFFLTQVVRSKIPERMDALLGLLDDLLKNVPVYKMQCTVSTDAAVMAYEAMRANAAE